MLNVKEKISKFEDQRLISIVCVHDKEFYLHYFFDDDGKIESVVIQVPKNEKIESIVDRYPNADYFEREIHDFFGIEFEGNPNMHLKLFLPDNWRKKPPLLKE